jgi:hypothetical protein
MMIRDLAQRRLDPSRGHSRCFDRILPGDQPGVCFRLEFADAVIAPNLS